MTSHEHLVDSDVARLSDDTYDGMDTDAAKPRALPPCRVNWQELMRRLTLVRRRWDLAVIVNLREDVGTRPAALLKSINAQAFNGRISWKVLVETLRRLEAEDYVERQEMPGPRETRYRLLPLARPLLTALGMLEAWYVEQDQADDEANAMASMMATLFPWMKPTEYELIISLVARPGTNGWTEAGGADVGLSPGAVPGEMVLYPIANARRPGARARQQADARIFAAAVHSRDKAHDHGELEDVVAGSWTG
jgi:DNA-binding HxlR family transcriptional regulator